MLEDNETVRRRRFALLRQFVPNFWYLEERSWFVSNVELQAKLMQVVELGQAQYVQVACGDFEESLDNILCRYEERKGEETVASKCKMSE